MVRHGSTGTVCWLVGVQWVEVKLHQDLFMIWPSAQTVPERSINRPQQNVPVPTSYPCPSLSVCCSFLHDLYICSTLSLPIARSLARAPVCSIPFDTQFNNFRNMFYDWKHIGYIFFPRSAVSFVGSFITETAHTTVQFLETLTILNRGVLLLCIC